MCIDSRDAVYLWGKWKNSGDGGQGTPWLYPKHFAGLSGWKVTGISSGNNSLFALSEKSTISWGQACGMGELGHGANKPRSATNAVLVDTMEGFEVLSVAAGFGQTLLIVDSGNATHSFAMNRLTLISYRRPTLCQAARLPAQHHRASGSLCQEGRCRACCDQTKG